MKFRPLRVVACALGSVGIALLLLVPATAALADSGYPTPNSTPTTADPCGGKGLPVIGQVNGVDICGTVSAQTASSSSGALAFTGGNIALLVGLGLVVVVGGVVLVRMSRRPKPTLHS